MIDIILLNYKKQWYLVKRKAQHILKQIHLQL